MAGQITTRMSNVKTTTNNLAELVGFTRAMDWAFVTSSIETSPVVLRYDSMYAAMIATGTWESQKAQVVFAVEAQRVMGATEEAQREEWSLHETC